MELYIPPEVSGLRAHYGSLLSDFHQFPTVADHLEALAQRLHEGLQAGVPVLWQEVNNYHPEFLGVSPEELAARSWSLDDARQVIASEFGYENWAAVKTLGLAPYMLPFELAIAHLLQGELEALTKQLQVFPALTTARSSYGHKATLLHYAAANGVEMWRQQVPHNLPEGVRLLVKAGADPTAAMWVYGDHHTPEALAATSAHPKQAGLLPELLQALQGH